MLCTLNSGKQQRLGLKTLKFVECQGCDCVLPAYMGWSLHSVAMLAWGAARLDGMQ